MAASSCIIAVFFAYSAWNITALEDLRVGPPDGGAFSFFEASNGRAIAVCNASPFYVSMSGLDITVLYQGDEKGTYSFASGALAPYASSILNGTFRSESYAESQYIFLHMDGQFSGDVPARLDPGMMLVRTDVKTSILGVIPYSVTKEHPAYDYYSLVNAGDCGP